MKVIAVVLALAASVASVAAEECDAAFIASLAATDDYTQCATDSGYSLASLTAPDNSTALSMCASTSCLSLLDRIDALSFGDCTIGSLTVMTDIVAPIDAVCGYDASEPTTDGGKFSILRKRCRYRCP